MEAKGHRTALTAVRSAKEEANSPPRTNDKNVVIRFCEFAYKVINEDMDDFFCDNMDAFDQDDEDIASGRGETFEQFEVYKKYLSEIESHIDSFSTLEGFETVRDCMAEINELLLRDEEDRRRFMKELREKFRQAHEQWAGKFTDKNSGDDVEVADAKAIALDSKHSVDEKEPIASERRVDRAEDKEVAESEDGSATAEDMALPIMMFFQPISMETMLEQVLSLTEYKTFSDIMRMKVKQRKLLISMRRRVQVQASRSRERRALLGFHERLEESAALAAGADHRGNTATHRYSSDDHVELDVLIAEYENLIDRICELTPNQKQISDEIRKVLDIGQWRQLVLGEVAGREAKGSDSRLSVGDQKLIFQRTIMNTAMCLWRVCSFEQQFIIRSHINVMLPRVAAIDEADPHLYRLFHRAEALFLSMSHELVDDIEKKTLFALEEYERIQEERRHTRHEAQHHK